MNLVRAVGSLHGGFKKSLKLVGADARRLTFYKIARSEPDQSLPTNGSTRECLGMCGRAGSISPLTPALSPLRGEGERSAKFIGLMPPFSGLRLSCTAAPTSSGLRSRQTFRRFENVLLSFCLPRPIGYGVVAAAAASTQWQPHNPGERDMDSP